MSLMNHNGIDVGSPEEVERAHATLTSATLTFERGPHSSQPQDGEMSIVHVVDRVKAGHGRGLTALAIAQAQHRAGWKVRLLLSGVHNSELLPGEPPHEALLGDLALDVYRDVGAVHRVTAALDLRTNPGDTIVCHEGIDLVAGCLLTNRRIVAAVHSNPEACLQYLPAPYLQAIACRTDQWIAWGTVVAMRLSESLGIDRKRITVSAQSVDVGSHSARALTGSPACLSVARIHPVKNHALMIKALAVLVKHSPGAHWHMVGGCDQVTYFRQLQGLARHLGVGERITWHGYRDDVAAMMLGSDVTVLASHSEGVPRAIQEAMVLGAPTVMPAALAGNLAHAGLPVMYQPNQPDALVRAIEAALLVDACRWADAARWVRHTWGWNRVLGDWERALAE
jgi:hypothetical protein